MILRRCLSIMLSASLALASLCACAQRGRAAAPTWSPRLELGSLAALPARLERPFQEPVDLVKGDAHVTAGNCAALLAARAQGASPAGDRDLAIARDEGAKCIALAKLSRARAPAAESLAGFDLRTATAAQLPAMLATPFGKRDDRGARAAEDRGQTLKDYKPEVAVQFASGMLVLKGDTWECRVEVLARGDFDGSGRDEMLLAAHDQATEGSFESTRLLLVARRAGDGTLVTLERLQ